MIHQQSSPFANHTVIIKSEVKHPQFQDFGGSEIIIEDWWDRVNGKSWMFCDGNPACLVYAMRIGFSDIPIPTDNEVLYGHTKDGLGHLIHKSEILSQQENRKG